MRVAPEIVLTPENRLRLEELVRNRATTARVAQRGRIVLLAAEGLQNKQIALRMHVTPRITALWRSRFLKLGVDGLLTDAKRTGRTPSISGQKINEILEKTTRVLPRKGPHWSRSAMARETGISESSVGRIWRSHGLAPHRDNLGDARASAEYSERRF
jgi:transposase